MATRHVTHLANLEKFDTWIKTHIARERGLGAKGFSAAVRLIIVYLHRLRHTAVMLRKQVGDDLDSFVLRRARARELLLEV